MINRLPAYFRQDIPDNFVLERIRLISDFKVNTVCQQAGCPNLSRCFNNSKLTFMILGSACSRNCRFCRVSINSANISGLDADEPYRVSRMVKMLGLKYVVITSVTRDDLYDGGAAQFAETIKLIHDIDKNINVEVLIPDFSGDVAGLKTVLEAAPCVLAHNIETVKRLYAQIRPRCAYETGLRLLSTVKQINPSLITKSSLILGMGETGEEVEETMKDLRAAQCDILVLGQYLAPSKEHYPVKEFISAGQFMEYRDIGLALGFKAVLSAPLARSSYQAEEVYRDLQDRVLIKG